MAVFQILSDVEEGRAESFMQRLRAFFAGGDYQVVGTAELYFQNVLYVLFRLLGLYVDVERHTTDGRMDILIQTPQYIYILELKIDQGADVALRQIEEKQYAAPFAHDDRRVFKIGVSFSSATRRLREYLIAES